MKKQKQMKPRERRYCEFFATGLYSQSGAMRQAGANPASSSEQATKLMKRDDIRAFIAELQDEDKRLRDIDAAYIRQSLGRIAHKTEMSGQHTEALSALDKLGKIHGVYEKDNVQRAEVSLKMDF